LAQLFAARLAGILQGIRISCSCLYSGTSWSFMDLRPQENQCFVWVLLI